MLDKFFSLFSHDIAIDLGTPYSLAVRLSSFELRLTERLQRGELNMEGSYA